MVHVVVADNYIQAAFFMERHKILMRDAIIITDPQGRERLMGIRGDPEFVTVHLLSHRWPSGGVRQLLQDRGLLDD